MTRERAKELAPIIAAYGEGKTIEYYDVTRNAWTDFSKHQNLYESVVYRIKPEPRMRPMTCGEVLYKVTSTPGMVVRSICKDEDGYYQKPMPAQWWDYAFNDITVLEWAIIDASGNPGEWHKFEVEE